MWLTATTDDSAVFDVGEAQLRLIEIHALDLPKSVFA
jgi:hypothetical protein